jgi:tRNA1Val (adenine37-N6)-methyltransferase
MDDTLDTLLRGRLAIFQGAKGYRVSLDSILLARFVTVGSAKRVLDLGCGNGAIALMLAALHPAARISGIEIQRQMVERAHRSVSWNQFDQRVEVRQGDVCVIETHFEPESFDLVVSNPPYRAPRSGRVNPDVEKQIARHEVQGRLMDFLRAAAYVLRKDGIFAAVFPAPRSIDLLAGMREKGIEPKRLRWVHAEAGDPAALALVEGVKGGGVELRVMPPLFIYTKERKYTSELIAILSD